MLIFPLVMIPVKDCSILIFFAAVEERDKP